MKKFVFGFVVLLFASCNSTTPKLPDRLPESELPAYHDAVIKMREYIVLEDSVFHITIPQDSALQMGVPKKYYNRIKQEIDYANHTIAESNKNGIPIEIDHCHCWEE